MNKCLVLLSFNASLLEDHEDHIVGVLLGDLLDLGETSHEGARECVGGVGAVHHDADPVAHLR